MLKKEHLLLSRGVQSSSYGSVHHDILGHCKKAVMVTVTLS